MPTIPDKRGRFGKYGGQYVPETLMPAMLELEQAYLAARRDKTFQAEVRQCLKQYNMSDAPLRSISPEASRKSSVEPKFS